MGKFNRLLHILNLIKARPGIKVSQLAQEAGVTERTIFRDVVSLSAVNIPIYYDRGYRILDTAFLPTLNFTPEEYRLLNMSLGCRAMQCGDYGNLTKALKSKIDAVLNKEVRERVGSLSLIYKIQINSFCDSRNFAPWGNILEQAIVSMRKVEIAYESINFGITQRVVQPYFLIFRQLAWHLLGFCELRGEFRLFKLERIKKITLLDKTFSRAPDFSTEKFFENKWSVLGGVLKSIKVKFKGTTARAILTNIHHSKEKINKLKDGSVIYSLNIEGLEEIARWLLGFGDQAEVLEPPELKKKMKSIAQNLSALYSSKKRRAHPP